ncbi:protein snakeskin [Aethina tumida]|uniref:protein snakeskin n=1 Tax=Aethina tumida TaxID=116153 RepID=UPI00096AFDD7|nr:protein snakeskin [Aethina tumida]
MTSPLTVGTLFIRLFSGVINLIVLILYRVGFQGEFLGVGGTWNLNEAKNPDAEIVASGIFVGYFIYTIISLIAFCFSVGDHKTTYTDVLMNLIGVFMWVAIGATALHYWNGYMAEHKYVSMNSERMIGLTLGALCLINGASYLINTAVGGIFIARYKSQQ